METSDEDAAVEVPGHNNDTESGPRQDYTNDSSDDDDDPHLDGSDDSNSVGDRFRRLEEEVATLVADVHDLALYTKLNFTGFIKIVKVGLMYEADLHADGSLSDDRNTT